MIIAEMRAADMPMEVLGLQVQRESIGEHLVELGRNLAHGVGGQIGRRIEGRGPLRRVSRARTLLFTASPCDCVAG